MFATDVKGRSDGNVLAPLQDDVDDDDVPGVWTISVGGSCPT